MTQDKILPKEITECCDTRQNIASFDYYDGIAEAKNRGLKQSISFKDVSNKTHFIVCCGDVMIKVESTDYPTIKRRII